jgi:hypothetical protein
VKRLWLIVGTGRFCALNARYHATLHLSKNFAERKNYRCPFFFVVVGTLDSPGCGTVRSGFASVQTGTGTLTASLGSRITMVKAIAARAANAAQNADPSQACM